MDDQCLRKLCGMSCSIAKPATTTRSCRCGIDVHAHVVPESSPAYLGGATPALWPSTAVITSNLMLRHPKLRIAFSHGGGTLASLLPRLEQGWSVFPALREQVQASPTAQARSLYFDTLVFDTPTLRHLADMFDDAQLMLGTDYPFNFHDRTPVARVDAAGFDAAAVERLVYKNAEAFLGLHAKTPSI